jgi:hypothetical protein
MQVAIIVLSAIIISHHGGPQQHLLDICRVSAIQDNIHICAALVVLCDTIYNFVPMLTCTAFTFEYAANPASPSSLPIPLCFTPPNGI